MEDYSNDESCAEKLQELIEKVKSKGYSEEVINKLVDALGMIEEEESEGEESDDVSKYDSMSHDDMRKDMHKKGMIVAIKLK